MNTTLHLITGSYAFDGALRGVASNDRACLVAPTAAPSTGEVRLQVIADTSRTRVVDSPNGGVYVRTWSPPV